MLEKTTPVMRPKKIAEQPWLKRVVEKSPGLLNDFFWKDGMIRVSGREYNGLIESPCHKGGKFSCLTCHSMHDSEPDDQLAKGMEGNQACLQCHETIGKDIAAHTRHSAASPGSACYNCHMPHTTYGLLKAMRSHQISSPTATESREAGRPNACNLCHLDKPLAWTVEQLQQWRKVQPPSMTQEEREVPAAVVWLLKGDAGQRALAAWHFGWPAAQQASGRDWIMPFLAPLLNDSYAAVRFIADRSLKTLPGTAGFEFDFTASATAQPNAAARATTLWKKSALPPGLSLEAIPKMIQAQDARPIHLRE